MKSVRLLPGLSISVHDLRPPCSNFNFIEKHFGKEAHPDEHTSLRRLLSLSRSFKGKTLVLEDLPEDGIVRSENEEIKALCPDHRMKGLQRLTFWRTRFDSTASIRRRSSQDLIGYAIVKKDVVKSRKLSRWHVFEAVFRSCPQDYTCIPHSRHFRVMVLGKVFSIPGVMYCQQNGLNKSCAQVALRSILMHHLRAGEISYQQINSIAVQHFEPHKEGERFDPGMGLQPAQIAAVLDGFGVEHTDFDYSDNLDLQDEVPYQRVLYSGIESRSGVLLGFSLKQDGKHIIPVFGHTFNKDTWRNYADAIYFRPGLMQYIPSDSWLGSFVAHDDNFTPPPPGYRR